MATPIQLVAITVFGLRGTLGIAFSQSVLEVNPISNDRLNRTGEYNNQREECFHESRLILLCEVMMKSG